MGEEGGLKEGTGVEVCGGHLGVFEDVAGEGEGLSWVWVWMCGCVCVCIVINISV